MSRTVAAQNSRNDGFAGLMDRLNQRAQEERSASRLDQEVSWRSGTLRSDAEQGISRAGSRRDSIASAPSQTAKRPLTSITEVKPARQRSGQDSVELSYEKALRLHGRRHSAEEADFDLPPANTTSPKSERLKTAAAAHTPPQAPKTTATRRNAAPNPLSQTQMANEPSTRPGGKRRAAASAASRGRSRNTPASGTGQPAKAARLSSASVQSLSSARSQARAMAVLQETKAAIEHGSSRSHSPKRGKSRAAGSTEGGRSREAKNPTKNAANVSAPKMLPEVQPELQSPGSQLELSSLHRRSILSMRLNEEEFTRLRSRAAESGLSVSAYMRSCVLEAEHLRAQVKQALAEMRAHAGPSESSQLSALARTVHGAAHSSGMWSRMIARSATFFIALWYPSRR